MGGKILKLALAAMVAPIGGVVLSALGLNLYSCLSLGCSIGDVGPTLGFSVFLGGFFGASVGLPVMLLFGIPLHATMMKIRLTGWLPYLLSGSAAGIIGAAAVASMLGVTTPPPDFLTRVSEIMRGAYQNLAIGVATGAVCSSIFWLIRRPDRDPPPTNGPEVTPLSEA